MMKGFNQERKKLEYLYKDTPSILSALFVLFSILMYTYYGVVATQNLVIWYSLNVVMLVFRFVIFMQYKQNKITKDNFQEYYWKFFVTMAFGAFFLGSGSFLILHSTIEYQMIFIILLAGLTSGTIVSLASYSQMFYTYLFFTITPLLYVMYAQNSETSNMITFFILLYAFTLVVLSRKITYAITHNIVLAEELKEKVVEANSANQAKSDFLSVMSHEIRTPLNAIMGFVQILLKKEKETTKIKYLNTIHQSSKVLTNVINDILDISKIESGNLVLESVEFNAKEEFETLFFLYEQNAKEKNVLLLNSIDKNIPDYLYTDILRLKQILSNLLSNAIKFTPEGKNIELRISFNAQTSCLHFAITDEGIGIAQENIEQITYAFTQADSSTARKYGGTGLGLSIVTKLLTLFETELEIHSKLGEGSRFEFTLPVKVSTKKIQVKQEEESFNFTNKKVLVAEDNKTNQMLIRILLEELDLEVTMADDGVIAEDIYKRSHFDLVLMDINMPNKNGLESLNAIREYEKEKDTYTPIIALTANSVSGDAEKYKREGFNDYLAKPIDDKKLLLVLKRYLLGHNI